MSYRGENGREPALRADHGAFVEPLEVLAVIDRGRGGEVKVERRSLATIGMILSF